MPKSNGNGEGQGKTVGKRVMLTQKTREKTRPKVLPVEERIAKHIAQGKHEAVLEETNEALASSSKPTQEKGMNETKLVSLLQLEKYHSALKHIGDMPDSALYAFEKIYCLYKLGKYRMALEDIKTVSRKDQELRMRHLEAQIRFRLGEYSKVVEMYNEMLNESELDQEEIGDIRTNILAAESRLETLQQERQVTLSSASIQTESTSSHPLFDDLENDIPKLAIHTRHGESRGKMSTTQRRNGRGKSRSKRPKALKDDPSKPMLAQPPAGTVSAERWMPKRERPSYRAQVAQKEKEKAKRAKKGKEVTGFGSQGARGGEQTTTGSSSGTGSEALGGTGSVGLARAQLMSASKTDTAPDGPPKPTVGQGVSAPKALLDTTSSKKKRKGKA